MQMYVYVDQQALLRTCGPATRCGRLAGNRVLVLHMNHLHPLFITVL